MFATFDPANDEDGLPISVRGPKQSWRANLFWGLLGLPMVVMPPGLAKSH
jgi:predicted cobalt transporter CbtA